MAVVFWVYPPLHSQITSDLGIPSLLGMEYEKKILRPFKEEIVHNKKIFSKKSLVKTRPIRVNCQKTLIYEGIPQLIIGDIMNLNSVCNVNDLIKRT